MEKLKRDNIDIFKQNRHPSIPFLFTLHIEEKCIKVPWSMCFDVTICCC